ncbi:poly-beta-1,6 N-acetyl-D-glucosamine export porin PgaA [Methylomonas sp. LL1]|uniref:poly-beta-1,6 N-acetyl-D-glucosamine export porin PgaA n=1 Tax=Methylomonas sp. LL1 TaxID=2785785 RepID=UPI0018C44723|nr:poly-beta-1,6 N-acetyl-D-glucosamine export porin PgaA [Methylomonas sp. LL1]QPK62837.1 poly-beta-1,6 N-acetyl-D-glucosamine export porin PgaA [Methylomonas sp. LL1]
MNRKILAAALWLPACSLFAQATEEESYQQALEQARSGQTKPALEQLKRLANAYPHQTKYLYDYLQVLLWAERDDEVLREAERVDLTLAPAYVLETVAKAARNKGQLARAAGLYQQAALQTPDRLAPNLGIGLVLLDRKQTKAAIAHFDKLSQRFPDNPELTLTLAHALEQDRQTHRASQQFKKVLSYQPDNSNAVFGLFRTQSASQDFTAAIVTINAHRPLFTDAEWAGVKWDHAAWLIRQGQQQLAANPDNFAKTDLAIAAVTANLAALHTLKLKDAANWQTRAVADLLVALHNRQRYDEVNDSYQNAVNHNLPLPTYALLAVADSQIKNRQPAAARDLYLQIIAGEPDNLDALEGLMRAYRDAGQTQDLAPLLDQIRILAEQNPDQPRYRYDLVLGLSWLGQDDEVLRQAQAIEINSAPVYILETVGRSARNKRDYDLAEKLYKRAADQAPERLAAKLALAWLMLDRQHTVAAIGYLQQLRQIHPDAIELILTQANAEELAGQPENAAEFYRRALEIDPAQPDALRGLAFALARTGQPDQALQIAAANRTLFSDETWAELKWSHAAWLIRQGEQALSRDVRDYRAIDQAIGELQNNLTLTGQLQLKDPEIWQHRAQFDLLVALRDRRRMNDAISLYQQLLQSNVYIPVYARMAAADAYLNERHPEQARDIYLDVLQEVPDYFNAKVSLAYAYLEAEQPDLALSTAEALSEQQPEKLTIKQADGGEITAPNPNKAAADMTASLFRAYVDDLNGAQSGLERLHLQYPDNTDIHGKLAEIYYFRGWPRKARHELDAARQQAPEHFGLKLNQARVAHELRDYESEQSLTHELYSYYPEDSGANKLMQNWKRHNKPELKLFTSGGLSSNAVTGSDPLIGSNNTEIDGYLYSSPLNRNFRVFTHEGWRTALFKETEGGRGFLRTYGAGVEYAKGDTLATAEIHYDNYRSEAVGIDLGLDYQVNDHWQLFTRLSSFDNNISLRALSAQEDNTKAKSARLGATYRVNESRYFNFTQSYYNFRDGNNRYGSSITYYERWFSGPLYKFATYLNLGYSTNTRPNDGFYFNPKQDASALLTLDNDWLTYRHYETDFHQRLAVTVGNYWQDTYGSNMVGNIQYEHRWRLGSDFELSYGGVRSYRFYDDALTENWQMYLTADIRF